MYYKWKLNSGHKKVLKIWKTLFWLSVNGVSRTQKFGSQKPVFCFCFFVTNQKNHPTLAWLTDRLTGRRTSNLPWASSWTIIPSPLHPHVLPRTLINSGFLLKAPFPISAAEPPRYKIHPQTVPCPIKESCVGNERLQCCISDDGYVVLLLG